MNNKMTIIPGWRDVSLSEIASVIMGQSPSSLSYNNKGMGLPLIQGNNDVRNDSTITRVWTSDVTKEAEKGAIILSVRAPVGEVAIAHEKVCIGRGVCAISSKYKNYLWYYFKYFESRWGNLEQGSTFSAVNSSDIKNLKINLPSEEEQGYMVAILETWDAAINKLIEEISHKKNVKRGLMQSLLNGDTRIDEPGTNWREYTIDELCEIKKGQDLSKEKLIVNGENKCILYGELYTKYSEIINEVVSRTDLDEGIRSHDGDILIPASTTTGALDLAIASCLQKKDVLLGGDINILRSKKDNDYDPRFLALYLTHAKKHNLARLAQGITIVHLYGKDFKKLKVRIPSKSEQGLIADVIISAENEINALEQKSRLLSDQKKYLLDNLITGTIRVTENLRIEGVISC